MDKVKYAESLELKIREAEETLYSLYKEFKYHLYTEYQYRDDMENQVGWLDNTDTILVYNSNGADYSKLHSDSLIDVLIYASTNLCVISMINNTRSNGEWSQIASFCRKNTDVLRAHPELEKLESLLATGTRENLLLVKELIKY